MTARGASTVWVTTDDTVAIGPAPLAGIPAPLIPIAPGMAPVFYGNPDQPGELER
jgi:hypothetical protein